MSKARYIMIGGFLGSGKTTAVARLAQRLKAEGNSVGLITNDQGSELVDTAMLRSKGFATEEIPGGCFCCRFNSLVDAARRLDTAARPDVFIAEPVGSCTDLVATVTYPLRRMYGEDFVVAPLSVLVDPVRALRVLGLEEGAKFSEKVTYIYLKQLEEADLVVINKIDQLTPEREKALRGALEHRLPGKPVLAASARTGQGLEDWFERVLRADPSKGASMEVDYDLYAEGEAQLGWLNCTVHLEDPSGFDGNEWTRELAIGIQGHLDRSGFEIAHLKMTLSPETGLGDLAAVNLVRNDFVPELSLELSAPIECGQLIVNLRAEAPPERLLAAVTRALEELCSRHPGLTARMEHEEHFRPGKPQPTHRLTSFAER